MKNKDEILFSWWNKQNQSKDELSTNDCIIGAMAEYAKQEAINFSEHLLHGDWRLNPHSEKTLWRTVNQVEQLGGTKPIDEGITTEQVYKLFKELHP